MTRGSDRLVVPLVSCHAKNIMFARYREHFAVYCHFGVAPPTIIRIPSVGLVPGLLARYLGCLVAGLKSFSTNPQAMLEAW